MAFKDKLYVNLMTHDFILFFKLFKKDKTACESMFSKSYLVL